MNRRRYFLPTIIVLLLAALWYMGLAWFIGLIPEAPSTDRVTTDAIVVLTGGSLRLEHGLELLARHRAEKLFISGVEDGLTLDQLLRHQDVHSLPSPAMRAEITLGYKARSTVGNAEEVAGWVRASNIRSIRLVTGNYHMPRSVLELQEASPQLVIVPEPVFPGPFTHNAWWQSGASFRLVLSEYHKYLASLTEHALHNEIHH